jgi:hypothetical protein
VSITDLKPYSYHMVKRSPHWFETSKYHITHEGKMIREVEGLTEEDLIAIVFLLNAAYQLGFSDGSVSR